MLAWEITNEITDKCHHSATKQRGWEQLTMVIGSYQQADDMGHSEADKGHRAAKGGGNRRQQTCYDEQPVSDPDNVYPQIFCILLAQHKRIEGFYQYERP